MYRPDATALSTDLVQQQPKALAEAEEAVEVVASQIAHGFELDVVEFAEAARDLGHVSGLVALAAIWNRAQVRTIGFDQHARERDVLRDFAQVIGLLESEYP